MPQKPMDLFLVKGLHAKSQHAVLDGTLGVLKFTVAADDHKPDGGELLLRLPDQVKAADPRHPDVREDQIRMKLLDF